MNTQPNIFLVGPMGAGKTTIGRQISRIINIEFMDSDHEIEQRTGASIPWIFDIEGEEGFRQREAAIIDDLSQRQGIVLATGGGAVLREENRLNLSQRGIVIYLYADLDKLFQRTARDRNRPLLQTENPKQRLADIMALRDPLYREVAELIVDTGALSLRATVSQIVDYVKNPLKDAPSQQ